MHILNTTAPVQMGRHGLLPAGGWLCHDLNAAELMVMGERGSSKTFSVGSQFKGEAEDQSLLIMRSGAIGDLLYLSPILRERKKLFPNLRLGLCCFKRWHEVMCDSGAELLDYPLSLEEARKWNVIASLEDTMELRHELHATDALNEGLGILAVPITDYKPAFVLNEFELAWGQAEYAKGSKVRVGLQCRAGVSNRDYPADLWMEVIKQLTTKHDCSVFLFGSKGQLPPLPKGTRATNLTERTLTFRQSASLLATCDLFAGVDSCFLPLCHALDIPAVGVYAAFDWKTRTAKAPRTFALTGVGECAPCHWHRRAGFSGPMNFPPDQKCAKEGFCNVLASITPERIVNKLMSLER